MDELGSYEPVRGPYEPFVSQVPAELRGRVGVFLVKNWTSLVEQLLVGDQSRRFVKGRIPSNYINPKLLVLNPKPFGSDSGRTLRGIDEESVKTAPLCTRCNPHGIRPVEAYTLTPNKSKPTTLRLDIVPLLR